MKQNLWWIKNVVGGGSYFVGLILFIVGRVQRLKRRTITETVEIKSN